MSEHELRVRLYRAENALLSAVMGVMRPAEAYMRDYPEPVKQPDQLEGSPHA